MQDDSRRIRTLLHPRGAEWCLSDVAQSVCRRERGPRRSIWRDGVESAGPFAEPTIFRAPLA